MAILLNLVKTRFQCRRLANKGCNVALNVGYMCDFELPKGDLMSFVRNIFNNSTVRQFNMNCVCIVHGYCTDCMLITAKLWWPGPDSRQVPFLFITVC